MVRQVAETPGLPGPPRGLPVTITTWAGDIVRVLSGVLAETHIRLNRVLPKDGTETMTAPLPLQSVLDAARPSASENEGGVLYVSDGGPGRVFQGSDGTSWVNLGGDPVDFMLEVAKGTVPGTSEYNKFGRNIAVASDDTEEIWDGSAAYVFPATALMTSISQTTDQVAMRGATIKVEGLDASWNFVTQNAVLGNPTTTVVTLATALLRCFRMEVQADVVGDADIRVHNAGETQDYAIILAGNNQTLMAIYTVPNGVTAYAPCWYATANAGGGAPTTLDMKLWARDNDNSYEKKLTHSMGVSADVDAYGHFQHVFGPYKKFTQKTDIYITATTVGSAVDVSAGFDLILVNN